MFLLRTVYNLICRILLNIQKNRNHKRHLKRNISCFFFGAFLFSVSFKCFVTQALQIEQAFFEVCHRQVEPQCEQQVA